MSNRISSSNSGTQSPPKPARGRLAVLLCYLCLAVTLYLGIQLILQAPGDLVTLDKLQIKLEPDRQTIVGRLALMQLPGAGSAESSHLGINRDHQGRWYLSNMARYKKVLIYRDGKSGRLLKRWRLQKGDRILIQGRVIEVVELDLDRQHLVLDHGGNRWRWTAGKATLNQGVAESCGESWIRSLFAKSHFSIGGLYHCTSSWHVPGVPLKAAVVFWQQNAFWVSPGRSERIYFQRDGKPVSFSQIHVPMTGDNGRVRRLILGRTLYAAATDGNTLTLTPLQGGHYWPRQALARNQCGVDKASRLQCADAPAHMTLHVKTESWLGTGAGWYPWLSTHPLWAAFCLGLAAASGLLLLIIQKNTVFWKRLYELAVVSPGMFFICMVPFIYMASPLPDLSLLMLLAWFGWFWATLILHWSGRLRGYGAWLWFFGLFFAISGCLTLIQLGVGSYNARWMGFTIKHLGVLSLFPWLVVLLNALPVIAWHVLLQHLAAKENGYWNKIRLIIPLLLLGMLILQVMFGDEKGVFSLQPVEFAKLVLVMMAAFVGFKLIELRRIGAMEYRKAPFAFIWKTAVAAVAFFAIIFAVMNAVRDFSPVLIISAFMLAMVWRLAAHPQKKNPHVTWLVRGAVIAPVCVFVGMAAWLYQEQPDFMSWLPQYDRIKVWSNPGAYPHSGAQLLSALKFIHAGQWLGWEQQFFGFNEQATRIPAVQNDFIAAFVIFKFGGIFALILFMAQLGFLYVLWRLSHYYRYEKSAGIYTEREANQIFSIMLFGFFWMFALHWLIAWGNGLGLLPIMGQPMSWISSANSHLGFFVLPAFYLSLVLSWGVLSRGGMPRGGSPPGTQFTPPAPRAR